MKLIITNLVIVLILFSIILFSAMRIEKIEAECKSSHICSDPTHTTCDGSCECDGFNCPKDGYRIEVDGTDSVLKVSLISITSGQEEIIADLSNDSTLVNILIQDNL